MINAKKAFQSFRDENIVSLDRLTSGHIHGSFHVITEQADYVLQHLNEHVFPDIEAVMHNALLLSTHLQMQTDYSFEVPIFLTTAGGASFLRNSSGCWRCLHYIGDPACSQTESVDLDPYEVANAFGQFSRIASRLNVDQLAITIPGFHDPDRRQSDYLNALSNPLPDRAAKSKDALARMAQLTQVWNWARNKGCEQVTHNDPKPSNILTDQAGSPLAIIDFDTVMPGSHFDDFGDLVRSMCCSHDENTDPHQEQITFDTNIYEQIFTGFTDGQDIPRTGTDEEDFQKLSAYIIYEQAARFLGDHLLGDKYYHVTFAGQNLLRALNQISLLESMLEQLDLRLK